jgi:hypothetical protein
MCAAQRAVRSGDRGAKRVELLLQRFTRRLRTFADLNLRVVNVRQHLTEVAHVEPLATPWAPHEMIGLGTGNAVSIEAGRGREDHSSFFVYPRALGQFRRGNLITRIADRTRCSRSAAGAGALALPRPVRVVFADPATIVTTEAPVHRLLDQKLAAVPAFNPRFLVARVAAFLEPAPDQWPAPLPIQPQPL